MTLFIETATPASASLDTSIDVLVESDGVPAALSTDVVTTDGRQYRPHPNGGGLVELTAFVAPTVFVGPNARVEELAIVLGQAEIRDNAVVGGHALVADRCIIGKKSRVGGRAVLREHVWMRHSARVDGNAVLIGAVTVEYTRHINAGTFIGTMLIC